MQTTNRKRGIDHSSAFTGCIRCRKLSIFGALIAAFLLSAVPMLSHATDGLQISDISNLKSVGDAQVSPDGTSAVYTIIRSDKPGRPYAELHIVNLSKGSSAPLFPLKKGDGTGGSPTWSPDGQWIAFIGNRSSGSGTELMMVRPDGSGLTPLAPVKGTNSPLPKTGNRIAWSPDSKTVAYISATAGPEDGLANGDPMVITRYLYKPHAGEGQTRFSDNRRLHIFVVDTATNNVRQITDGDYSEHSISWSPNGRQIAFLSNRNEDPDRVFNYDIFTVDPVGGTVQRLTDTKSVEYGPVWSPDGNSIAYLGTKRSLTSSETTMEDTHVWIMNADGSDRREISAQLDARHGFPEWTADSKYLYFTAQQRGSQRLARVSTATNVVDLVEQSATDPLGVIRNWSVASNGTLVYAMARTNDVAQLFFKRPGQKTKQLTSLNERVLNGRKIAPVEAFVFKSFDGMEIEAFLTSPVDMEKGAKYPLVTMIHGGPHGQQGPTFDTRAQIFAAHGFATLMVNYRGSTGYGQEFADAIFKDQNGGEAKDVLAGVDAALARYSWIDEDRLGIEGGSYGGQLTNWLITQTDRFKAAIPRASISNLVSFNYMAYYHDYLAVEFGGYPTENGIMDELWRRSPLRYVDRVTTPTMLVHGEHDNDVPIAEAEQFYIALHDVGVDTIMIRYPREGHGLREVAHVQDWIERSLEWYDKYFAESN